MVQKATTPCRSRRHQIVIVLDESGFRSEAFLHIHEIVGAVLAIVISTIVGLDQVPMVMRKHGGKRICIEIKRACGVIRYSNEMELLPAFIALNLN